MIMAAAVQDAIRPIGELSGDELSLPPERAPGFSDRAVGDIDREAHGSG